MHLLLRTWDQQEHDHSSVHPTPLSYAPRPNLETLILQERIFFLLVPHLYLSIPSRCICSMTLGQQISYHDKLPARKSPLRYQYSNTNYSNCRPYDYGTDSTRYHLTTYFHQPAFPPSRMLGFVSMPTFGSESIIANRFSVLAKLGQSRTRSRWAFDYTPTLATGERRRSRRAEKHQSFMTPAANDQEGDQDKSISGLGKRTKVMQLKDGGPYRTEKPDTANHNRGPPTVEVEPESESDRFNWAPQFRPNGSLYTRPTTAAEQKILPDEVQPCTVPTSPASVDAPHIRESEPWFAKPTSASPLKINNGHQESTIVFLPSIQAISPSCCTGAPRSPPTKVAIPTIFAMDWTHPTSAGEAEEYHTIVTQDEQLSSMETIVPLPGLGQTPRPGTFPSSIIVDGKVVTFEPGKNGLHLHSDPPFVCPWQRFPLLATDGRCTRSQSPFCVMANYYNNAAGICHPLGTVGMTGHGTLCWCTECLKSQVAIYGVERLPRPPVQVSQAANEPVSNSPSDVGGVKIEVASTREMIESETLDSNGLNTGTAATKTIITDADTNISAVTTATAATTIMSVIPAPSSTVRSLSFSAIYHSLEPANGWPAIPRLISRVMSPAFAASSSDPSLPPHSTVTQSLPEVLLTQSENGDENSDKIPQVQVQVQDEYSKYIDISPVSLPSAWDVVSPVSTGSHPTESFGFTSSGDDDDEAHGGSTDRSS